MMRFLLATCLSIVSACVPPDPGKWDQANREGQRIVRRAIERIGSLDAISANGPFAIAGTGTLDKAAEGQGYTPARPSPGAYREVLAFDFQNTRFAHEYREDRYDGTFEWLRVLHTPDDLRTWIVFPLRIAAPERSHTARAERLRLLRRLPHALLDEIARDSAGIRWLGKSAETDLVATSLESRTDITVAFDAQGDPLQLEYETLLPARGPTTIVWHWSDWRDVEGRGRFPFRYTVTVGDQPYLDLFVDSISGATDARFTVPPEIRTLPLPDHSTDGEVLYTDHDVPSIELQEVAPGVFTALGVRSGFAPLVVAFDSFSIAVDAPASFPLLAEIPAAETDPGPYKGWIGDRFVAAIQKRLPDRPIRYVVLTHAHEDHIGGVRAFVAAGATVLAAANVRPEVERIVNLPVNAMHDRLAFSDTPLRFEPIDSTFTIEDRSRSVRILAIEPNPHHDKLFAVFVEDADLLFVSDLVTPTALDNYPRHDLAPLDLSFLRWLEARELQPQRILAMHGSGEVGAEHLARLRALVKTSAEAADFRTDPDSAH